LHEFRCRVGCGRAAAESTNICSRRWSPLMPGQPWSVGLIDATDLPAGLWRPSKKSTGQYSAARAALGGAAHSRRDRADVSSATRSTHYAYGLHPLSDRGAVGATGQLGDAPPNVSEGGLAGSQPAILPTNNGTGGPPLVVAGHGVFGGGRPNSNVVSVGAWAVLTKLRSDMKLVPPYVGVGFRRPARRGEPLRWLGYDGWAGRTTGLAVGAEPETVQPLLGSSALARVNLRTCPPPARDVVGPVAAGPVGLAQQVLQQVRARGLNRHSPSRRTNWGLGTPCFLQQPAVHLDGWHLSGRMRRCLLRARACWGGPPLRPAAGKLDAVPTAAGIGGRKTPVPFLSKPNTTHKNPQ